ncbi:hypothetical protein TWF281_000261 [Arthrobotrys megalospora]
MVTETIVLQTLKSVHDPPTPLRDPMPYEGSLPIPPHLLKDYFSTFEPRISPIYEQENAKIRQLHHDWVARGCCHIKGGLTEAGPFLSLICPESIPDRILSLAAHNDLGWIDDDFTDGDIFTEEEQIEGEAVTKKYLTAINQLKSKLIVDMLNDDPESITFIQSYENWVRRQVETDGLVNLISEFGSLDEYLNERCVTAGGECAIMILLYLHDIKLTDEQLDCLDPLSRLAIQAGALTNDYFSAHKEWANYISKLAKNPALEIPISGVFLTMRTEDISMEEAKKIVRSKYLDVEQSFLNEREALAKDAVCAGASKEEVERYISSLQFLMCGNMVFHMHSPRYQLDSRNPLHNFDEKTKFSELLHQAREYSGKQRSRVEKTASSVEHGGRTPIPESHQTGKSCILDRQNELQGSQLNGNEVPSWLARYGGLSEEIVSEPFEYVSSLPSKKVRKLAIEALDIWYQVPQQSMDTINTIIDILHSSSLIIDDIEDGSELRRGYPAAHMVFGTPQAINAANYLFVKALEEVEKLPGTLGSSLSPIKIYRQELRNLHIGQAMDLHWTFHTQCPSEAEYIRMIDGKTGGLFRMAGSLMRSQATINKDMDVNDLLVLMGRYFQIRDDYQNLGSADYSKAKGDLSDLDEGKYSFMLIHALNNAKGTQLKSLLQLRGRSEKGLSVEQKRLIMRSLERSKSMEYTLRVLEQLQDAVEKKLEEMEGGTVERNWMLRAIMARLRIADPKLRHLRR